MVSPISDSPLLTSSYFTKLNYLQMWNRTRAITGTQISEQNHRQTATIYSDTYKIGQVSSWSSIFIESASCLLVHYLLYNGVGWLIHTTAYVHLTLLWDKELQIYKSYVFGGWSVQPSSIVWFFDPPPPGPLFTNNAARWITWVFTVANVPHPPTNIGVNPIPPYM